MSPVHPQAREIELARAQAAQAAADLAAASIAPAADAATPPAVDDDLSEPSPEPPTAPSPAPALDPRTAAREQIRILELQLQRRRATAKHAPTIRDQMKVEKRLDAIEDEILRLHELAWPAVGDASYAYGYCRSRTCGALLYGRHDAYEMAGLCTQCWNLAVRNHG